MMMLRKTAAFVTGVAEITFRWSFLLLLPRCKLKSKHGVNECSY